eukprot:g10879.t1
MATSISGFRDAGGKAADLALRIGSQGADAVSFVVELGEELPFISPVLKTLTAIRDKVGTVRSNREELEALKDRCTYVTACAVVKCRQNAVSKMDVTPLEDCVKGVWMFVERCSRRGRVSRVLKASGDKDEIAGLNARVDRLTGDLGLAGIAVLEGKADDVKAMLERISTSQEMMMGSLPKSPTKLANVPIATPTLKSWHVERHHVTHTVLEALTGDGGPRLVGLVGDSGSGKTTAASEIVRSTEARTAFLDGILWLTVNEGAGRNLPSLMLQLARMVYEDILESVGRRPAESNDGTAYIKQRICAGHGGKGLKCLVVADNVWDKAVISKLLETGMWVLLSARDEELVASQSGEVVCVDELSGTDAESVLRKAAELPPSVRLPDDAVNLVELCGRVAMDLAFVGRWSTVRGRQDRKAWSDAAEHVRAEMRQVGCDPENDVVEITRVLRRKAVLRAGFEDLAVGSEDKRVPWLYLSLAVMPDGHPFSVKDAAVLLFDRVPSADDEASVRGVLDILERWTIVRSAEMGVLRMHDAHSSFARENLMDRGDVRRPASKRWVSRISSLDALQSINSHVLKGLWAAVERVGGDGWAKTRPYEAALAGMDESDPSLRESVEAVGWLQAEHEDWEGASDTFRRLLEVEKRELGPDHPFLANTLQHLADWAERLGKVEEAMRWREKERQVFSLALAKLRPRAGHGGAEGLDDEGLVSLASTMLRLAPHDKDEAESILRRSLEIQEAKLGPENLQVAFTLHELGVCVREAGRPEEAEGLLRRCLTIREVNLGPDDVEVAVTLFWLGVCVREAGRLDEAEELLRRCLAIKEAKLGPEDVQVAYTLHQLGTYIREAGRLEEAGKLLRQCLGIKEAKLAPGAMQVAKTLHQLGVVCARDAGRLDEARELFRRCLGIVEAKLVPEGAKDSNPSDRRTRQSLQKAKGCLEQCLAAEGAALECQDVGLQEELGVCLHEACYTA